MARRLYNIYKLSAVWPSTRIKSKQSTSLKANPSHAAQTYKTNEMVHINFMPLFMCIYGRGPPSHRL